MECDTNVPPNSKTQTGGGMQEIFDKVKSNNNIEYAKYIEYRVGDRILETNKLQIGNKKSQ